jgi:tetraacyldisaccharide 4'-kinase
VNEQLRALLAGTRRGPTARLQRCGLRLASWPYGLAVGVRNGLFDRGWRRPQQAAVPVVSIGNLTVGGTGKTPCVEYVASRLRRWEKRAAILSRGYGSDGGPNDEALVLQQNLPDVPHLQGADRVALARIACEELDSEVLVLDDGFQHRRLARALDIVLVDATEPWGFGYLLPRGLLREPPTGLRRAGVVILTRCDQAAAHTVEELRNRVARLAPQAVLVESSHRPREWVNAQQRSQAIEALRGKTALAFCGIGNPDAFRRTLVDLGVTVTAIRAFPDHHPYTRTDVEALRTWVRQEATNGVVVTTQKDLVKLGLTRLDDCELWALRIGFQPHTGREALDRKLKEALG